MTHSIISKNTDSEFILSTNVKTPIKIVGVAEGSVRENKTSSWKKGFFCFYENNGIMEKAEINEELYDALHLVFTNLGNNHEYGFDGEHALDDTIFTND